MPAPTFLDGLQLTERIQAALRDDGIRTPTDVQTRAFQPILDGQDVLMHSGTGTGKTLAYLLPILQRLREAEGRAAVIAPSAELAMQTLRVARAYMDEDLTAEAAIATSNRQRERKRLTRSTRLVIGTPDRIVELWRGGKLKGIHTLVLDELDPILASREAEPLHALLSRSEPKLQCVVATATLSKRADAFLATFMADALRIDAPDAPLKESICHHVVRVPPSSGKEVVITRFIQQHKAYPAIVFAADDRHHAHLLRFLEEHRVPAATLSQQRSKQQRQRGLDAFRAGDVRVLITTDATARGLDVPDVAWVLHYDVPPVGALYVHRAGRTGRAGQTGTSVIFLSDNERSGLRRLEQQLPVRFSAFREGSAAGGSAR